MPKIKNALVYGAGMMGKGIAQVLSARPGINIIVYDVRPVDLCAVLQQSFLPFVEAEILSAQQAEERISRVSFVTELTPNNCHEIDLVVECVYEDLDLKRKTFCELENLCRADTIFCTNTSVMSPSEISRDMTHRQRFVGTHFWNPAHLIPLVEVIKSDATSDETADVVMALLTECGKKPVLCKKDVPGFIANRMQHALWREAISIVEHGIADAKTVDEAVKNSFGLRLAQLGPLENADMAGLDLTYNIHNYVLPALESSPEPSPLLAELNERKELGFKSGQGFYSWTSEEKERVSSGLNKYLFDIIVRMQGKQKK